MPRRADVTVEVSFRARRPDSYVLLTSFFPPSLSSTSVTFPTPCYSLSTICHSRTFLYMTNLCTGINTAVRRRLVPSEFTVIIPVFSSVCRNSPLVDLPPREPLSSQERAASDFLTCTIPSHRELEAKRRARNGANFQLKSQIQLKSPKTGALQAGNQNSEMELRSSTSNFSKTKYIVL